MGQFDAPLIEKYGLPGASGSGATGATGEPGVGSGLSPRTTSATPYGGAVPFYVLGQITAAAAVNASPSSGSTGQIQYSKFIMGASRRITAAAMHVTTAGASGLSARAALYYDAGELPGSLYTRLGEFSLSTTGPKLVSDLSIPLSANSIYWVMTQSNATHGSQPLVRGFPTDAQMPLGMRSGFSFVSRLRSAGTYEDALPDPAIFDGSDIADAATTPAVFVTFA